MGQRNTTWIFMATEINRLRKLFITITKYSSSLNQMWILSRSTKSK